MTAPIATRPDVDQTLPVTPYVGLVPYGEKDAPFFFGREEEKRIVTANLRAARLTVLYGPSGVGKSSLLLAGVVHGLRASVTRSVEEHLDRAPFAVCVFRSWSDEPLPALVEAIREGCVEALGGEELPAWQPAESLVETLRAWTQRVRTVLVVLDQFEDYFLYPEEAADGGGFGSEFPNIVNEPNLRVNFLLSIREDAWAKLDRFEGRIPELFANYVRVEHLDRESAREAIESPIGVWNDRLPGTAQPYTIEPELVGAVVEAAASGRLALAEGASAAPVEPASSTEAVEAPFLQLVMDRLWRATVDTGERALTLERLRELGGAQQIVESHLVDALGALEPDERAVAAELFRFLVTRSKTKIAHSASDLAEWTTRPETEVTSVLEHLCRGESGRILRAIAAPAGDPEGTRYELFHDVLAEPILDWRKRYEQQRESEELAERLEAEQLARREADAQRHRERRNRFIRIAAVTLLVLAAVLAALSAVAVAQWRDAVGLTHEVRSQKLAGDSEQDLSVDPVRAVLRAALGVDEKPTPEATGALENALAASHVEALFHGHEGRVLGAAFSPDGTFVTTAGADGTTRIWEASTGRNLAVLNGHRKAVRSLAFSTDGTRVVTAGMDGTARIWSVPDGREVAVLAPSERYKHSGYVVPFVSAAFSSDGRRVLMMSPDGAARVWEVGTAAEVLVVRAPRGDGVLNSAAFSPDGDRIAVASDDETAQVWEVASKKRLATMSPHDGSVVTVSFSPNGARVVTMDEFGAVRIWETTSGDLLKAHVFFESLAVDENGRVGATFSPDGKRVSVVGNGIARIWDLSTGKIRKLRGATREFRVVSATFSPDSTRLATAQGDRTTRLWDAESGEAAGVFRGHGSTHTAAFSSDGGRVVTASEDGSATVWTARRGRMLTTIGGTGSVVSGATFTSDGTGIIALSNGPARILPLISGSEPTVLAGEPQPSYHAAFSPDGRLVATADHDDNARIWDARGHLLATLRGHRDRIWVTAFSPDGKRLVTASSDHTTRIWNVSNRRASIILRGRGSFYGASFSPDGRVVATTGSDHTARLWDAATGRLVLVMRLGGSGYGVDFSPDGRRVAIVGEEGIKIRSVATGEPVASPRGLPREIYAVDFSPDGGSLVVAGLRGLRIWELASGKSFAVGGVHDVAYGAVFSNDGTLVATSGRDGTTGIWSVAIRDRVSALSIPGSGYGVNFSPDGRLLAIPGRHGTRIWSVAVKDTVRVLGADGPVTSALAGDGGLAMTLSEGVARVWDPTTGRSVELAGRSDVTSMAFTRDGERIATGFDDGTAGVWDAKTGSPVAGLGKDLGRVTTLAFSPDGERLVTGSDRHVPRIWDIATSTPIHDLKGQAGKVNATVFSLDGQFIATASEDGTARVWLSRSGKPFKVLSGHTGSVNDVAFSSDGTSVVTASDDKTAIVWTANGARVHVLRGHTGVVDHAIFDPDGKLVLTTSRDGTARVWDTRVGATCAVLGRDPARIASARFVGADGTVLTVSSDGSVRTQRNETCAKAVTGDLEDIARRFLRHLPTDTRSELSTRRSAR